MNALGSQNTAAICSRITRSNTVYVSSFPRDKFRNVTFVPAVMGHP